MVQSLQSLVNRTDVSSFHSSLGGQKAREFIRAKVNYEVGD